MARRNNQRKNSHASQKGTSSGAQKPMSPPTNPAPAAPIDYRTSYADHLLSNDERYKRHQRAAAQNSQVTHINANPEKYRQKMESLEKATPETVGGMNQTAINEWEDFIFKKMQAEDDNNEDHDLEDFL